MKNGHRITVTDDQRCGTCRRPVGIMVFGRAKPCTCPPEAHWCECGHTVDFYRHYPERRPAPATQEDRS